MASWIEPRGTCTVGYLRACRRNLCAAVCGATIIISSHQSLLSRWSSNNAPSAQTLGLPAHQTATPLLETTAEHSQRVSCLTMQRNLIADQFPAATQTVRHDVHNHVNMGEVVPLGRPGGVSQRLCWITCASFPSTASATAHGGSTSKYWRKGVDSSPASLLKSV